MDYFAQIELGLRIKSLRTEKGLTQEKLAESLGISVEYVGKIERGKRTPSLDLVIAMSKFFHASTDYILLANRRTTELG
ncbi:MULTISPECIES: helix-turn-helix domain-containing protein [Butyricicoccaceae]|jgi:transcriptional regulator with XRE-family HTH domain|uniref:helix-turn-helix domain-containing protein n=1 Tax=Butyricicoccaceae TaxID=3085642 RepID=UPI000E4F4668|nr:helix-turn-helix transcriptional regulator [Butyricicoccus sp. AM78-15b2TA]RHS80881.1 XRE family transcriptional regulator [Butyricicoccus sp. AM42-5AC]RHT45512.1 XRE family transcriptional regulator [Butyricicoccus sp. AM29-23AC]RHV39687.1 XRE family transcriptional regulator [Butyricicoccus sp. OM04-18BH]